MMDFAGWPLPLDGSPQFDWSVPAGGTVYTGQRNMELPFR